MEVWGAHYHPFVTRGGWFDSVLQDHWDHRGLDALAKAFLTSLQASAAAEPPSPQAVANLAWAPGGSEKCRR